MITKEQFELGSIFKFDTYDDDELLMDEKLLAMLTKKTFIAKSVLDGNRGWTCEFAMLNEEGNDFQVKIFESDLENPTYFQFVQ